VTRAPAETGDSRGLCQAAPFFADFRPLFG